MNPSPATPLCRDWQWSESRFKSTCRCGAIVLFKPSCSEWRLARARPGARACPQLQHCKGDSPGEHLEPCQNPILGHDVPISVYSDIEPDIGYDIADTGYRDMSRYHVPISGYPISGPISGYTDIGTKCHDIGSLSFPISHTMSLVPSRPRAQDWGWLSGCCRLLVITRESFIQCNELCLFFPAAAAAPAAPGLPTPAAGAAGGGGVEGGGELVNAWLCTMSSSANL